MENQFKSKKFKKFNNKFMNSMNKHQDEYLKDMLDDDRLTICMPTGTGKSRIIQGDLIDHIKDTREDVFTIATHRLMLNTQHISEIFEKLSIVLGSIGFIFVGSREFDVSEFMETTKMNKKMKELSLNYDDLILSTTSSDEIEQSVSKHQRAGRDVIIISTYHSLDRLKNLDINTIYCDEAHLLATEKEQSDFKNNFKQLTFDRSYFFTATPRDLKDLESKGGDSFLMDNEDIFGKRIGLTFKESIDSGYIVSPIIHVAQPKQDPKNLDNIDNYVKFIVDVYKAHKKWLNNVSSDPDMISPKLLIKNTSVDHIWKINERLIGHPDLKDVNIFAGASKNEITANKHMKNNTSVEDRNDFLKQMQDMDATDEAIILHYDILSEGINVPGITGVMFLSKTLPNLTKLLQNTGRSTRLFPEDRKRLLDNDISVDDLSDWIKPHCAVILPVLNNESKKSIDYMSTRIDELIENFGFDPTFYFSSGEDISKSSSNDNLESLTNKNIKKEKPVLLEKMKYIKLFENYTKKN
jgi:Kyanoviridae helicase